MTGPQSLRAGDVTPTEERYVNISIPRDISHQPTLSFSTELVFLGISAELEHYHSLIGRLVPG